MLDSESWYKIRVMARKVILDEIRRKKFWLIIFAPLLIVPAALAFMESRNRSDTVKIVSIYSDEQPEEERLRTYMVGYLQGAERRGGKPGVTPRYTFVAKPAHIDQIEVEGAEISRDLRAGKIKAGFIIFRLPGKNTPRILATGNVGDTDAQNLIKDVEQGLRVYPLLDGKSAKDIEKTMSTISIPVEVTFTAEGKSEGEKQASGGGINKSGLSAGLLMLLFLAIITGSTLGASRLAFLPSGSRSRETVLVEFISFGPKETILGKMLGSVCIGLIIASVYFALLLSVALLLNLSLVSFRGVALLAFFGITHLLLDAALSTYITALQKNPEQLSVLRIFQQLYPAGLMVLAMRGVGSPESDLSRTLAMCPLTGTFFTSSRFFLAEKVAYWEIALAILSQLSMLVVVYYMAINRYVASILGADFGRTERQAQKDESKAAEAPTNTAA